MRADELMTGDWLQNTSGILFQVTEIFENGVNGVNEVGEWCDLYDVIKPIPIDLDILEKNGWKGDAGENIRFKSPYILAKKNDVWTMYYNGARIVEICYVHELQNIMRMLGYEGGFKL